MIQRIQTLYIIIGAVFCFLGTNFIVILKVGLILLTLFTILNYHKRTVQKKGVYLMILFSFLGLFFSVQESSFLNMLSNNIVNNNAIDLNVLLISSSIIFYILAIKNIKRDEDLIKSIDRLR